MDGNFWQEFFSSLIHGKKRPNQKNFQNLSFKYHNKIVRAAIPKGRTLYINQTLGTHSKKFPQRMLSSWLLHRRHSHLGNTSTVNDKMYCLCDCQWKKKKKTFCRIEPMSSTILIFISKRQFTSILYCEWSIETPYFKDEIKLYRYPRYRIQFLKLKLSRRNRVEHDDVSA